MQQQKRGNTVPLISKKSVFLLFLFILLEIFLFIFISGIYKKNILLDRKLEVQTSLQNYGRSISHGLNKNMAILTILQETMITHMDEEDKKEDFLLTAQALYKGKEGIRALQVFPDEGPMFLYPESTNELVKMRHLEDLINDDRPQVREDVQRAIESRKIAISGPYELRQGGLGLVARLAIFRDDTLWGIAVIVFDLPPLFEQAGLDAIPENLEIGLKDSRGTFFAGNAQDFEDPLRYTITLPDQNWELQAQPAGDWFASYEREWRFFRLLSFLLLSSVTVSLFLSMRHKARLENWLQIKSRDLNKSQYLLNRTQQIAHIGSWEIDVVKKEFSWSEELENILKLNLESMDDPKEEILKRIPSDDRLRLIRDYKHNLDENRLRFDLEHLFLRGDDKETRLMRAQCEILKNTRQEVQYILGTTQDITEEKKTSEELHRAKKQFEEAVLKAPVAMVITDNDQNILLFNERFTQDFGYTLEDISTIDQWWELCYPDTQYRNYVMTTWFTAIEEAEKRNRHIEMMEFDLTAKDRLKHRVEFQMTALGEFNVVTMNDVTRQRDMQQELNHRNRMDSLGQLAGGLAHDINNILNIILNSAQMLEQQSPDTALEYLNMIETACNRASGLTGNLLRFSRKGEKRMKNVDLNTLLDEIGYILKSSLNKKILLEIQKNGEKYHITGDESVLQNALLNLGINAGHAIKGEGRIQYILNNIHLDADECRESSFDLQPGEYAEILIIDTGKGIPEEILPKIFDPFFTTKEQGEGTGLGLSAVYGTIIEHKGSIEVNSDLHSGTRFRLLLPLAEAVEETTKTDEQATQPSGELVLLVDDEESIRKVVQAQLKSLGYRVILAKNGSEAVEIFRKEHKKLDIIILDMVMPVMDGREAYLKIQEIDSECPVIISSGYLKDNSIEELMSKGLSGFIPKPYTRAELHKTLQDILKKKVQG